MIWELVAGTGAVMVGAAGALIELDQPLPGRRVALITTLLVVGLTAVVVGMLGLLERGLR